MARGRGRPPTNSKKNGSEDVKKDSVPSPKSKPRPLSKKPGRELRSGKIYLPTPTPKANPPSSSKKDNNVDRTKNSVKPTLTNSEIPKAITARKSTAARLRAASEFEPSIEKTIFDKIKYPKNAKKVAKPTTRGTKDNVDHTKNSVKPNLTNKKVPKMIFVSDTSSEVEIIIEKNTTTNKVKDEQKIASKKVVADDAIDGIDIFLNDYDDFSEDEEEILKYNNQLKKNVLKPKSSGCNPSLASPKTKDPGSSSSSAQIKNLTEKEFNASIDDNDNFKDLGTPKFASTPARCIIEGEESQFTAKVYRPPAHDFSMLDLTKNTRDFEIYDSELPQVLTNTPPGPAWKLSSETSEKMTLQFYAILGKTPPKKQKDLNQTPRVPKTPGLYIDWEDKVDEIVHFGRRPLNETKFSEANTSFNSTNKTFNSTNASDFTDSDDEDQENLDSCFSIEKYMNIKPKPLDDILPDPSMVDNMIKNSRQIEDEEPMDCSELNPEIATQLKENRFKVNQKKQFSAWRGIQLNSYTETSKESIYIVVDTNVFIDRLEDILSLVKKPQPSHPYFVYIPWIVLQELDGLKSNVNTKLQKAASKAAREILELFNARNKRLSGQNGKMDNEAKEMFKIQDPLNDDKIIQACLQLRKDGKHVQLVSFDNILKIKAHSYQIEIFQTNKLQSVQVAAKKRAAPVKCMDQPTAMDIEEPIPTKKKRFDNHSSKVATSSSKSSASAIISKATNHSNEKKSYTSKAANNIQKRNAPIRSAALLPSKIGGNQTNTQIYLTGRANTSMPSEIQSANPQPMDFTENTTETEVMRKEILNNLENANESFVDANPSNSNNTSQRIAHNSMPKPETSTQTPYKSRAAQLIRSRNAPISSSPKIFEIPKTSVKPKSCQSTENTPEVTNRLHGRSAPLIRSPSIFDLDNFDEIPKNFVKPKVISQSAENNVESSTKNNSVKPNTMINNKVVPKPTPPPKKSINSLKKSFASERVKNRLEKNKSK